MQQLNVVVGLGTDGVQEQMLQKGKWFYREGLHGLYAD